MRRNKKILAILSAVAAFVFITAGVALSYFTNRESITNTFTVGDLQLGLREPDWNLEEGDGEHVYPGYSVYKNPTIKNITSDKNGPQPCYARMRIILAGKDGVRIEDADRLALIKTIIRYDDTYTGTYEETGTGEQIVPGRSPGYSLEEIETLPMINPIFTVDEERSNDSEIVCNYMGIDGRGILEIKEQATLFTLLAIPTGWTKKEIDLLGDFQILVQAEAIQITGFETQSAAFEILDKKTEDDV